MNKEKLRELTEPKNTLPTASGFLFKNHPADAIPPTPKQVEQWLINFADMHVEAALKAAAESLDSEYSYAYSSESSKFDEAYKSVLSAYPLTNIK